MERSFVLLVQPPQHPEKFNFEDNLAACVTEEEWRARWEEYHRLKRVFENLGFVQAEREVYSVSAKGCDWYSAALVDEYRISDANIQILEGKVEERRKLIEGALAKLTTEEQVALNLICQE